jgi:hypothetical protein
MNKFVQVFLGSRGILEEVELVESELTLNDYYEDIVEKIKDEMKEDCEDEEDLEFMTEFVNLENHEGFSIVGLNEEEYLVVFDFKDDEELCKKLLKFWKNQDEDSIRNIVDNLQF